MVTPSSESGVSAKCLRCVGNRHRLHAGCMQDRLVPLCISHRRYFTVLLIVISSFHSPLLPYIITWSPATLYINTPLCRDINRRYSEAANPFLSLAPPLHFANYFYYVAIPPPSILTTDSDGVSALSEGNGGLSRRPPLKILLWIFHQKPIHFFQHHPQTNGSSGELVPAV